MRVHILRDVPPEEKGISSTEIRERMVKGEEWVNLVPETAAELLIEWDVPERVKEFFRFL